MPGTQINLTYVCVMPCSMCFSCRRPVHLPTSMISPGDWECESQPGVRLCPAIVTTWETPWRWLMSVQPVEEKENNKTSDISWLLLWFQPSSFKGMTVTCRRAQEQWRPALSSVLWPHLHQSHVQHPPAPTDGWEPLPEKQRFPYPAEKGQQGCPSACCRRNGKGREKGVAWGQFCLWNHQAVFSIWESKEFFLPAAMKIQFMKIQVFNINFFRERTELGSHGRSTRDFFLCWDKTKKSIGRRNII